MIATQTVQMVLLGRCSRSITLLGHVQLWEVYAIAALTGVALVFDAPSRQNLTFQMVGRDELPNAIALNSSLFNTARIFGPGARRASSSPRWARLGFAINAASYLAVLAEPARDAQVRALPARSTAGARRSGAARAKGFAYARRNRTVLVILSMMVVFSSVCFNFNILLPLLAKNTLDAGPQTFGVISAVLRSGRAARRAVGGGDVERPLAHPCSRARPASEPASS